MMINHKKVSKILSQVLEVEYIYISSYNVFTIINNFDIEVLSHIYDKEIILHNQFPSTLFDFHVIFRYNKDVNKLNLTEAKQIYKRKKEK
ncbi:hypothetical protein LCGC14_2293570 [marine sediment metagenome]|uniref:Uncharacterized protein n=1 Tax=marine sediment metagenome TaxID=412755 RepID=A0A0F9F302_9ZZZZ